MGPLDLLRQYQNIPGNVEKLLKYTQSRLPAPLRSVGDLQPMPGGTGRKAFALGPDLIVKTARMPRGLMENRLATDTYAPLPEHVYLSDDDVINVVRRAQPVDTELRRGVNRIQSEFYGAPNRQHPEWHGPFQEAVSDAGFGDLLNYDALWGDVMPRNVGRFGGNPVLLDEGILSREILNPKSVMSDVPLDLWNSYVRDIKAAKAAGGFVE